MKFRYIPRVLLAAFFVAVSVYAEEPAAKPAVVDYPWNDTTKPYGIDKRTAWTTSHVTGTPEPPLPYTTERIFPHLHFDRSLEIVNAPDNHRWYVCEHGGLVYSFPKDNNVERPELFLDIRRKDDRFLAWNEHRQLWSIAFHPKFYSNGYVYVCYYDMQPKPARCRISRFTFDVKNPPWPPSCDVDSEYIILEWVSAIDHHGGCLRFGNDGMLYFSAGDGSAGYDGNNTGQDISDLNAAIMRIDVDHPPGGRTYAIPADNPFVNMPGARGEVWAYGLRNVWKMSFDRATGDLWAGDVGQDLYDMVDHIEKGGNYGWSIVEGTHALLPDRKRGPTPILTPAAEHDHSEVRSVTGGYVYHGTRLKELTGSYIYGDYETGRIYSIRWDGKKATKPELLAQTTLRIVGFGEDKDGELVLLDYMGTLNRMIPRPPTENTAPFPKLLSETGLFASTKDHTPAPGLIPYNVNSPLWSDNALKERFIALPNQSKIDFSGTDAWHFPEGTVLVKTFSMEMKSGDPTSVKHLETRLLHFEQGQWRFYTYLWNNEQTDAELLGKDSLDRELTIGDPAAPGGVRKQTWHFPSRAECILCHNQSPGYVLGVNTPQLNRDFNYGAAVDNQLRTMAHLNVFSQSIKSYYQKSSPDAPAPKLWKLADPRDATASVEDRARSYLHANCSHCHRFYGGGNATFNMLITNPLKSNAIVDTPPLHGDFGIERAKLIAPGHPEKSIIPYRMSQLKEGRMPQLASSVLDEPAIKVITEWIAKMGNNN